MRPFQISSAGPQSCHTATSSLLSWRQRKECRFVSNPHLVILRNNLVIYSNQLSVMYSSQRMSCLVFTHVTVSLIFTLGARGVFFFCSYFVCFLFVLLQLRFTNLTPGTGHKQGEKCGGFGGDFCMPFSIWCFFSRSLS